MKTSEQIKEIMMAIQKVQQQAGTISKNAKGQVGTREYKYANLNDTWETIKDLMQQNDLVVVQSPTSGESSMGQLFSTTIYHTESGQWIEERMLMTLTKSDPQAIGAAITYYRRYMLTSMLGLIPDDDNDARDHRLATSDQKRKIVGAVKQVYPDITKAEDVISTITNIVGKHPGNIRENEAEDAIALIKSFTASTFKDEE